MSLLVKNVNLNRKSGLLKVFPAVVVEKEPVLLHGLNRTHLFRFV